MRFNVPASATIGRINVSSLPSSNRETVLSDAAPSDRIAQNAPFITQEEFPIRFVLLFGFCGAVLWRMRLKMGSVTGAAAVAAAF